MSMRDTTSRVTDPVRSTAEDVTATVGATRDSVAAVVAAVLAPVWAVLWTVAAPVVTPVRSAVGTVRSGAEPVTAPVRARLAAFSEWRHERPFAGGVLLFLGGLVVGWVPIQFAAELMLIGGSFTVVGLLFASLMVVTAGFVLAYPQFSRQLGVVGVVLSLLSLIGALGGLGLGLVLGLVGGNLCIAWERPPSAEEDDPEPPAADENRISDATATLRTAISND